MHREWLSNIGHLSNQKATKFKICIIDQSIEYETVDADTLVSTTYIMYVAMIFP